ncbi:MAG TPA: hypothetical protein VGR07_16495 [Thermoanaerobaculia bacterium]|nr:hypothetical protein [Thermoanaerobaculia bacterium]
MSLDAARRLFPGYEAATLEAPGNLPFLLSRLLEDGDGADLRRLFAEVPEVSEAVAAWLATRGGRQLSVRSRAFWGLVLDTAVPPAAPEISALWPL